MKYNGLKKGDKFNFGGTNYTKLGEGFIDEDYNYFKDSAYEVNVSLGHVMYIEINKLKIGDRFKIGNKFFTIVDTAFISEFIFCISNDVIYKYPKSYMVQV